ncbi:MAG: PIN domain-containing protein [Planctomycetota bacterium]|jgi:tRNA(fMet)-specific endonuclease VapC
MRLLDTDTCIEILRGNRDVIERRASVQDMVGTTWMTAAELHFGAARSKQPGPNRRVVAEFLGTLPVLGLDAAAAERFGALKAKLENAGRRLADADLLIASVALACGALLVTGNTRHYDRIPKLQTENWIPR